MGLVEAPRTGLLPCLCFRVYTADRYLGWDRANGRKDHVGQAGVRENGNPVGSRLTARRGASKPSAFGKEGSLELWHAPLHISAHSVSGALAWWVRDLEHCQVWLAWPHTLSTYTHAHVSYSPIPPTQIR